MPRASTSLALLAVAIVAVAGAYLVGARRAANEAPVAPQTAAATAQATVAPQTAAPAAEATVAPEKTPAPPASGVMDEAAFWRLTAETRGAAGNDTGRQSELLETRLRELPPEQIAAFEQIRRGLDRGAYTWDVWGAAYVVEDGCSDDCFRDFRAYLISLGQAAVRDGAARPRRTRRHRRGRGDRGLGERRRRRAGCLRGRRRRGHPRGLVRPLGRSERHAVGRRSGRGAGPALPEPRRALPLTAASVAAARPG